MKKMAIFTGFTAASLADATIFVTSTTYIQLAVAVLFFLPLAYFAIKLFPRKTRLESPTLQSPPKDISLEHTPSKQQKREKVEVSDIDKRTMLKLVGAAGISFFLSSLFAKRFGTNIFGKPEEPGLTTIQDPIGNIIDPAKHHPTDDFKISEVDYGISTFYGFINSGEGWFIMKEDINAGSYRYVKGDTNFRDNWNDRNNLKYDYFNRVFPE